MDTTIICYYNFNAKTNNEFNRSCDVVCIAVRTRLTRYNVNLNEWPTSRQCDFNCGIYIPRALAVFKISNFE